MVKLGITAAPHERTKAASTMVLLCGLALTWAVLPSENAADVFTVAAIGIGLSLGIGTYIEAAAGVRNLIRVDILILWVLYGLTFLEFLFPQSNVETLVSPSAAMSGTSAAILGFAGLSIGRLLIPTRARDSCDYSQLGPGHIFALFMFATMVGYAHIFIAVNFDPFEALRQMSLPRFSQSWGRGQYGDAYSLLYELGMLIYVVPPIAGLIYARADQYELWQKLIVSITFLITLYYGFASGTRNVFATYV